jgi:hypothetical protein
MAPTPQAGHFSIAPRSIEPKIGLGGLLSLR